MKAEKNFTLALESNWSKAVTLLLIGVALAAPSAASTDVRGDLLAVADAVAQAGQTAAAAQLEEAVTALSDEELERVYGEADLAGLAQVFAANAEALETIGQMINAEVPFTAGGDKSPGFPDATGYPSRYLCPFSPERSNGDDLLIAVDAVKAAREALEAAQIVWSGLSRGCDQVAFGTNTSLLCIPADIVLAAAELVVGIAEGVVEHLAACDAGVDSAEIEGSYERLGHIHWDLTAHDSDVSNQLSAHDADISSELATHDQELRSQLTTHDADVQSQLATHDQELKSQLATHDAVISSQLATHDVDLKSQLATHDADIETLLENLQGTADENQRLIKIYMSRQLEVMRLLITPTGLREINEDVLTCTGHDCPEYPAVQLCPNGSLKWNCRR